MQDFFLFYYFVGLTYTILNFMDKELHKDLVYLTLFEWLFLPLIFLVAMPLAFPWLNCWEWKQVYN